MDRSTIVGVVAGAITVTAIGAVAGYKLAGSESQSLAPAEVAQAEQAPSVAAAATKPGEKPRARPPQYADVVAVTPVTKAVNTPREECHDEVVTHTAPVKDEHQVAGTVAGAVIGGVVGHQFGAGSGKKAMTVAGAVAGGYAGNKVEEKMQQADTYTTTERRCTTVSDSSQQVVGYDVTYLWNGEERVARMDRNPGSRVTIRNGQPVS